MHSRLLLACSIVMLFASSIQAAEKSPLGELLKDIDVAPHWIYDDLPLAKAEAKATGKPLLVVLRCVPCPPGRTLDQQVMQPDAELEKLEKQFVCVRVIQTNGLDLKTFQYDYDMSWSAMFLNADLTIYGRYGTRNSTGAQSDILLSQAGFSKAAERALALHRDFDKHKSALAAKTGKDPEYAVPEKTPGLTDKPTPASTKQNCIHCHMVKEFALRAKWEAGRLNKEDLYVFPMPDRVGLTFDTADGLLVKSVQSGSAADKAGIQAGDTLSLLAGQPLISTADVQWILNSTPSTSELPLTLTRDGKSLNKTLALSGNWKEYDIGWRASTWYGLRQGVKFELLPAAEREKQGIKDDTLALVVKGLFGKGGPKVQAAGLKAGDVIVAVDGKSEPLSESDFLVQMRLAHGPQDSVKLTVLRAGARKELTIPMW
ncbi:Periplasmic serine endoprotease DegP precursor [Anatilimnocola aggregata]|uniref:Periplasmic serine endoprotease DegP n=1 Tax=Anatilimnocola aggregata TaxID=2528021 RepID=A0A517YHD6_9BACT|nr:Trx7/PDZ domain-containing (seleno)protein [Anatilimnocola aggregata]QDU29623.1 Periplasmic serine endoprotease DegP precursor [Anatilimnocola aggregata]